MIDIERATIDFYDREGHSWAEGHNSQDFWEELRHPFWDNLPAGSEILEIGAGAGRDAEELGRRYKYTGTDVSQTLLDIARRRNPKLRFKLQSVYELKFDRLFDGFWASAVLLHIPRARIGEALQAIKRNLRDGAIGFISLKEGDGESPDETGRFFTFWTEPGFRAVLNQNGFEVLEVGRKEFPKTKWLVFTVKNVN